MSTWTPIEGEKYRLPAKGEVVLVTTARGKVRVANYLGKGLCDLIPGSYVCEAIAWMPLPEPYRKDAK